MNEDERQDLLASHPNDPRVNPRNVTINVVMPDGVTYPGTVDEQGVLVVHTNGARDNAGLITPIDELLDRVPLQPPPTRISFTPGKIEQQPIPPEKLDAWAVQTDEPPWNWCPECDGPAQCSAGSCPGSPYPEGWTVEDGFMIIDACYCGRLGYRHKRGGPNCRAEES